MELLEQIRDEGMFEALEAGTFADMRRPKTGGKGLEGTFERAPDYYNPIEAELRARTGLSGE
jgi:beta-lysine 5,6-aminomutase alpha subunit